MAYENCDSFISFIKRCDFPKYDRFTALKQFVDDHAMGCPLCCGDVHLKQKNICAGHGEYYDTMYIYCDHCRLSYSFYVPLGTSGVDFWDLAESWICAWNRRI